MKQFLLAVGVFCQVIMGGMMIYAALPAAAPGQVTRVPVVFSGGFETDPRDRGRPVILIAAALGVTDEVFRDAFSNVRPAGPGSGGPTEAEAHANKKVLMDALGKHGISNDKLDSVSNYYRYMRSNGEMWKHEDAEAVALVKDGVVVGYEVTKAGAGYSSPPAVTVPGVANAKAKVSLSFTKKFKTNGSVTSITPETETAK